MPQSWRQHRYQMVVLSVIVIGQCLKSMIREARTIDLCSRSDRSQVSTGIMEDADHRAAAVVTAFKDRAGQRQKPPHQIERLCRIRLSNLVDDGTALRFQIVNQGAPVLPVDKGARSRDRGQPLANLLGNLTGALR